MPNNLPKKETSSPKTVTAISVNQIAGTTGMMLVAAAVIAVILTIVVASR